MKPKVNALNFFVILLGCVACTTRAPFQQASVSDAILEFHHFGDAGDRIPSSAPSDKPLRGGARMSTPTSGASATDVYAPIYCEALSGETKIPDASAYARSLINTRNARTRHDETFEAVHYKPYDVHISAKEVTLSVLAEKGFCQSDHPEQDNAETLNQRWRMQAPGADDRIVAYYKKSSGLLSKMALDYFPLQIQDKVGQAQVRIPTDRLISEKELEDLDRDSSKVKSIYITFYYAFPLRDRDHYADLCSPSGAVPHKGGNITEEAVVDAAAWDRGYCGPAYMRMRGEGEDRKYVLYSGRVAILLNAKMVNHHLEIEVPSDP